MEGSHYFPGSSRKACYCRQWQLSGILQRIWKSKANDGLGTKTRKILAYSLSPSHFPFLVCAAHMRCPTEGAQDCRGAVLVPQVGQFPVERQNMSWGVPWGVRALQRKGRRNRAPVCRSSATSELQFALFFQERLGKKC